MRANKILIVEDDPLWQNFLQEALEADYTLTVVATREEAKIALDRAKEAGAPFDLVTVDIGLENDAPTLDGEALLTYVNQHHRTKCIVVTGHHSVGMSKLRSYFREFEVFDFVGKAEFDIVQFKEIVNRAFYLHGFRILAEMGRGGMGTVYKALDPRRNNQIVALKVLHHDNRLTEGEQQRRLARFRQEIETACRLQHPNIVTVLDYAVNQGTKDQLYFVMEFLDGQTLQEILATFTQLPQNQILSIGRQLCEALAYAHAQQVIHRDIKPSNIILLTNGDAKLTDFGIAKVLDAEVALTRTEDIVGTLEYMPPEQILNAKAADARVDIYAVGAVLYELLSGQRLYADPLQKLQHNPRPLRQVSPHLPAWLSAAIMKALAREPDKRFQSAQEMAQALRSQETQQ
jgi:serine/threonine protein kinase